MTEVELYTHRAADSFRRGQQWLAAGDLRRAARNFSIAEEFGFDHDRVRLELARVRIFQNRFTHAFRILESLLERKPECATAHYCIGHMYRLQGRKREALGHFRKALAGDADNLLRVLVVRELRFLNIASDNLLTQLLAHAEKTVRETAGEDSFREQRARAILFQLQGKYSRALAEMRKTYHASGKNVLILKDLGLLHVQGADLKRAVVVLGKLHRKLPQERETRWELARCNLKLGRLRKAARALANLKSDPTVNPAVYVNHGNILVRQGKHVAAINLFKKALQINKHYFPALFALGSLYHRTGSLDLAQYFYEQAYLEDRRNPYVLYNLGILFYEAGDYVAATRLFRRCVAVAPKLEAAQRNLDFVLLARRCYPNEGPNEGFGGMEHYYWLGIGSVIFVLGFTILQGVL